MSSWQVTHGNIIGAYLKVGPNELYVRKEGAKSWLWFLDGFRMGAENNEARARAAAEASVRVVHKTHIASVATPAG